MSAEKKPIKKTIVTSNLVISVGLFLVTAFITYKWITGGFEVREK